MRGRLYTGEKFEFCDEHIRTEYPGREENGVRERKEKAHVVLSAELRSPEGPCVSLGRK